MTFAEIVWRTRSLAGLELTEAADDRVVVRNAVDDAYSEVCSLQRWLFLRSETSFPTVADQADYALPAPLRHVEAVSTARHGALLPRVARAIAEWPTGLYAADAQNPGGPGYVLTAPDTLTLIPTPDSVFTVTISGWLQVGLLSDGGPLLFDPEFHQVVAYMAASTLLESRPAEKGDNRLAAYRERVSGYLARMNRSYQVDQDRTPIALGSRRSPDLGSNPRLYS